MSWQRVSSTGFEPLATTRGAQASATAVYLVLAQQWWGLGIMGKLLFLTQLSGRRVFLRNCAVLGIGAAVFGKTVAEGPATPPADPVASSAPGGFVVINGWVLPSGYFRDGQA
ncbi:hypothetical protein ACIPM0_10435 [Pseudomonas sichuanensis]|uniref:hypothetical protein n=1 Tax=Pseudomonas TaxID=286 RepID=UPI003805F095